MDENRNIVSIPLENLPQKVHTIFGFSTTSLMNISKNIFQTGLKNTMIILERL